jgi:hypothetical protein
MVFNVCFQMELVPLQRVALQRAQEAAALRGLAQPGQEAATGGELRLPTATPFPSSAAAAAAASGEAVKALGGGCAEAVELAAGGSGAGEGAQPTTFLCLENMLSLEALNIVEEREDVELDVRDECGKCGAVLGVSVPLPPPAGGATWWGVYSCGIWLTHSSLKAPGFNP